MNLARFDFVPKGLWPLWGAGFVSTVGDSFYQVAILWMIYDLTGSATATGLIGLSQYLPAILFGPLAGAHADRYDRKRVMILSDVVRAVLVAAIPIVFYSGQMSGIKLGVLAFVISMFTAAFLPARDSIVPMIVARSDLTRANSLLQASYGFAYFLGPVLAAGVLAAFETPVLFFANSVTYLVSLAFLMRLRTGGIQREARTESAWSALIAGFRYARRTPLVKGLLLITAVDNLFIMGPALVGSPLYVRTHLKLGPEAFTAIQAAFALGVITGSVLIGRIGGSLPRGKMLLWALIWDGITFAPLMLTDSLIPVLVVWYVHSIGIPFILIPRTTLVQSRVPEALHGRIFSMIHLTVIGLSSLSCALTGIAAEVIPVNKIYAVIGVSATVVGAFGWLVKELREAK